MNGTALAYAGLTGNGLLDLLDGDGSRRLLVFSSVVYLETGRTLHAPGAALRHAYFPAGCVLAACVGTDGGAAVETALVGREGAAGLCAVLGARRAHELTRVVLPGDALRVEAQALRELFAADPRWRELLLRYYGALVRQTSRRAVCNTRHRLSERLPTWLLMLSDRADCDDFPLTQEAAARQLGVRRAGVNECVRALERAGVVEHGRGRIRVLSREALAAAACPCYPASGEEARWLDRAASGAPAARR